jgi:adenosylhomocysteine nucleosidase
MEVEVELLKQELGIAGKRTFAGLDFFSGVMAGHPVVVVRSGVGKVNAALCAHLLIREFGVTRIINTGIAGAIAPDLRPLDMVLSTDAVYHDVDVTGFGYAPTQIPGMDPAFVADKLLLDAAERVCTTREFPVHYFKGRVATGDVFVSSAERKARIKEICNPLCVEMEGAAIAHACVLNHTPFVIVRCISDMAEDTAESASVFNEKTAADLCARIAIGILKAIK